MENQRAHLNALPAPLMRRTLINERRMRHPPRPPVKLAVETLDQKHLLRRLPAQIVPPVLCVRSDRVRLPSAIGVDQRDGDEIGVGDRVRLRDGEGVSGNWLDRAPDVDDLVAGLQEGLGELREVVGHAGAGGGVGLVDVHSVDGAAEGYWCWCRCRVLVGVAVGLDALVFLRASDRVVEDEDAGCTGSDRPSC